MVCAVWNHFDDVFLFFFHFGDNYKYTTKIIFILKTICSFSCACAALSGKTLTLAASRPLTLSHRGPDVPQDTMSNSTWLSYLAGLLLDHMPDRTAGDKEQLWGWLARCWRQTGGWGRSLTGTRDSQYHTGKRYEQYVVTTRWKQTDIEQPSKVT